MRRLAFALSVLISALNAQTDRGVRLEIQVGHSDPVTAATFSTDGALALTGSPGVVTLWDMATRRQIYQVHGNWPAMRSLLFHGTEEFWVAALSNSARFDLKTGRPLAPLFQVLDSCADGSLILTPES